MHYLRFCGCSFWLSTPKIMSLMLNNFIFDSSSHLRRKNIHCSSERSGHRPKHFHPVCVIFELNSLSSFAVKSDRISNFSTYIFIISHFNISNNFYKQFFEKNIFFRVLVGITAHQTVPKSLLSNRE